MKKIAVDFRIMDAPSGSRGIGYYTFNQFQAVENLAHPEYEFVYFTAWHGKKGQSLKLADGDKFLSLPSSHWPLRGIRRLDPIFAKFWQMAVKKTKPDLIHISSPIDSIYVESPKLS